MLKRSPEDIENQAVDCYCRRNRKTNNRCSKESVGQILLKAVSGTDHWRKEQSLFQKNGGPALCDGNDDKNPEKSRESLVRKRLQCSATLIEIISEGKDDHRDKYVHQQSNIQRFYKNFIEIDIVAVQLIFSLSLRTC